MLCAPYAAASLVLVKLQIPGRQVRAKAMPLKILKLPAVAFATVKESRQCKRWRRQTLGIRADGYKRMCLSLEARKTGRQLAGTRAAPPGDSQNRKWSFRQPVEHGPY